MGTRLPNRAARLVGEHTDRRIGGGGGNRTRVRKHSAFGSTCLAASLLLAASPPDGQGSATASPLGFSEVLRDEGLHELVKCDPWSPSAQARPGQRLAGIKQLERSCRRWQLTWFAAGLTRLSAPRHAPRVLLPTSKPGRPRFVSSRRAVYARRVIGSNMGFGGAVHKSAPRVG